MGHELSEMSAYEGRRPHHTILEIQKGYAVAHPCPGVDAFTQLRTGYVPLQMHLHRKRKADSQRVKEGTNFGSPLPDHMPGRRKTK